MALTTKKVWTTVQSKIRTIFGVDRRSLALMRVMLGVIGIFDLIDRFPDIKAHYSDEGFLPRATAAEHFWHPNWFSYHMWSGNVIHIQLLFLLNALVCFSVLVGYRSRTSMFLMWTFILSIQSRNNIVGHGGDLYLRCMAFFAMFLPIGDVWSLDSAFKRPVIRREFKKYNVLSIVTVAVLLQVSFLYVFSFIHKTGDEWRKDYTATFLALKLDYFKTAPTEYIVPYFEVLKVLTFLVLYYEGYGILLCLSPVYTSQLKTLGALAFFGLHVGFGLFMRLGIFSPVCAAGSVLLFPAWMWDKLLGSLKSKERSNFKLYYSAKTGYTIAGIASTFFLLPEVEVARIPQNFKDVLSGGDGAYSRDDSLFSNANNQPQQIAAVAPWIITKDSKGTFHTGYNAFTSILRASPILWPFARLSQTSIVRAGSRKVFKMWVANDNEFNKQSKTAANISTEVGQRLDSSDGANDEDHHVFKKPKGIRPFKLARKAVVNGFIGFCIVLIFMWNCQSANTGLDITFPHKYQDFMFALRLDQMWSMFSPRPPAVLWWYSFEAELDNGASTELWANDGMFTMKGNPAPFSVGKPWPYASCVGNHRWFKMYEIYNAGTNFEIVRRGFGKWLCNEWNSQHAGGERLYKFNVVYRSEQQHYNYTTSPLDPMVLWTQQCYDKPVVHVAPTPQPVYIPPPQQEQQQQQQDQQQQAPQISPPSQELLKQQEEMQREYERQQALLQQQQQPEIIVQ
ncbi:hypothetical protein SAMD00019534_036940 [Acytostelium subglobosum LB1]|uniref:hypothetical protein n=1 Tax=Acytostelium subglobosum LB1 TaxID=1410327 RepID=UPI000645022A|nr:hypothetical protein SAMD00019534_036940 [Acytostelium subglobosum LB1]GAM20519.1 hypothetical protein SAMD00019534_036940 [Acytostelium subglobosum LB1]|eukprot:XP_012760040.1 hypothetical protein SAMD00019534_036940 [Acytostelium subglobosum LB1]